MELKFVWIKDFRNIKEVGFPFDNQEGHRFEYRNGILEVSDSKPLPKYFFSENVTACTAIVGKNGSGKTNLADFISHSISAFSSDGGASWWWEERKYRSIIVIGRLIEIHDSIRLDNVEDLEKLGYIVHKYSRYPLQEVEVDFPEIYSTLTNNKLVYFSNGFKADARYKVESVIDISTDFLLYHDSENLAWQSEYERRTYVSNFIDSENHRNAKLILDHKEMLRSIKVDSFSAVLLTDYIHNNYRGKIALGKRFLDFSREIVDQAKGSLYTNDEIEKKHGLNYLLRSTVQYEGYVKLYCNLIVNAHKINGLLSHKIEMPDLERFVLDMQFFIPTAGAKRLNQLKKNILALKYFVKDAEINVTNYSRDFNLNVDDRMIESCLKQTTFHFSNLTEFEHIKKHLIESFEELEGFKAFYFGINNNMSTGENAMLRLYARLYMALGKLKNIVTGAADHVKIFLDEPEVQMHPEWQRSFLDSLLRFLETYYKDYKIQLIISSHSPFILSEIPASNALILDKDKDTGKCKISSIGAALTFGANIHALFRDSFFMKTTIGEFASNRINRLSARINEYPVNREEYDALLAEIELIGEPVIRETLRAELETRQRAPSHEEERLKKELIRLRRILAKNNLLDDDFD